MKHYKIVNAPSDVTDLLKSTMQEDNITQKQVADRLGVKANAVSAIVSRGNMTVDKLISLCNACNYKLCIGFTEDESVEPSHIDDGTTKSELIDREYKPILNGSYRTFSLFDNDYYEKYCEDWQVIRGRFGTMFLILGINAIKAFEFLITAFSQCRNSEMETDYIKQACEKYDVLIRQVADDEIFVKPNFIIEWRAKYGK